MNMILFWIILLVVLLIAEIATTALVSIWFVGGALVALIAALLHLPVWIQAAAFIIVSAMLFGTCREWLSRHFTPSLTTTNTQSLIGSIGTVTVPIHPTNGGRVLVSGQDWKAVSANGASIEEGELVKVKSISGVKLVVLHIPKEIADHPLI